MSRVLFAIAYTYLIELSLHYRKKLFILFALFVPLRIVFIDVFDRLIEIVKIIEAVDGFGENFKVAKEKNLGEHEFLIDCEILFN